MSEHLQDKISVLVIDDEESFRRGLYWSFKDEFQVFEADSRAAAIDVLQHEEIDVVLCDLHLPPDEKDITEGLAIIRTINQETPHPPVIVLTGESNPKSALEAIRQGAYGYLEKAFDANDILPLIRQAARVSRLEKELFSLRLENRREKGFSSLIGTNKALEKVLTQARIVAATDATVLITGESGTGKGVLAKTIHEESPRRNGQFVSISCGALPETLIESELFGYEKGAFTGASHQKKGRIEFADGGTLFLDEISELSLGVQVKLLQLIQEKTYERLGGTKTLTIDVRLIAATNRDLEEEVKAGKFRCDLFYRLNVIPLTLPPLRERTEDIPLLASAFITKFSKKHNRPELRVSPLLMDALQEHDWKGNVRELENLIERLIVLTTGDELGIEFLPDKMLKSLPKTDSGNGETLEDAVRALKKSKIIEALEQENSNKNAAALRLGISRSYLYRLMDELGL
jgi:DNA-binding NtrC family response regulator